MTLSIFDLFGFFGVAGHVLGYGLLQTGYIRGHAYSYALFNAGRAGFTLLALVADFNLYSATIQAFFLTFSVIGMIRVFLIMRRLNFSYEERRFLATKGRGLSRVAARKLLDQGEWRQAAPGQHVTKQGEPVEGLFFVSTGVLDVLVDGTKVAELHSGDFVGELTCLNRLPAPASVVTTSPTRTFFLETERLRSIMAADTEINGHLSASMREDISRKLVRINERVSVMSND